MGKSFRIESQGEQKAEISHTKKYDKTLQITAADAVFFPP